MNSIIAFLIVSLLVSPLFSHNVSNSISVSSSILKVITMVLELIFTPRIFLEVLLISVSGYETMESGDYGITTKGTVLRASTSCL